MRSQHDRPIDRTSLTRQFLAAAVDRAVDTGLPRLTPVDAMQQKRAKEKNEPTAPPTRSSPFVNRNKPPAATRPASSSPSVPPVEAGLRQLTPVDAMQQKRASEKTNPPPRSARATQVATLSSRQLAAARLLACGRAPAEVADEIGISRQALWKWRRRADFAAEVFRLHECLVWTAGATAGRRR